MGRAEGRRFWEDGEEEDQGFLPSMLDRQTERQKQRERHTTGVVTETLAGLLRPPPGLSLTTPSPSPSRPPPPLPTPPFLPSFLRLLLFLPSLCSRVSLLSLAPAFFLHIFGRRRYLLLHLLLSPFSGLLLPPSALLSP